MFDDIGDSDDDGGIESFNGHAQLFWGKLLVFCPMEIKLLLRAIRNSFDMIYLLRSIGLEVKSQCQGQDLPC